MTIYIEYEELKNIINRNNRNNRNIYIYIEKEKYNHI